MKQNKLINYISTLSKEEWKQFQKFSKCQYTDRSVNKALFDYLKVNADLIRKKIFDYDKFHEVVCPHLSIKAFQNIISEAAKVVEEYFIWQEIQESNIEKKTILLFALQKRGLYGEFDRHALNTSKEITNSPTSIWNNYRQMKIEHIRYFSDNPAKVDLGQKILESLSDYFDLFTNNLSLFYKTEMINRNNWKEEIWESKIESVPTNSLKTQIDKILYHIIHIQNGAQESYDFLEEVFVNKLDTIDNELQVIIQLHLHKYVNISILDTKLRGLKKLKLFKFALDHDILYSQDKLPLIRFHNIVDTACRIKEFKWAESFIASCKFHLDATSRNNSIKLSKAQVYFASKNRKLASDRVIDLLSNLTFSNFRQELRAKTMLICSFFESHTLKTDQDFMKSSVNTYRRFIERRKKELTENEYIGLSNLIICIRHLLRKKTPPFTELLTMLEVEKVFFKSWVIDRIKELQSHKS